MDTYLKLIWWSGPVILITFRLMAGWLMYHKMERKQSWPIWNAILTLCWRYYGKSLRNRQDTRPSTDIWTHNLSNAHECYSLDSDIQALQFSFTGDTCVLHILTAQLSPRLGTSVKFHFSWNICEHVVSYGCETWTERASEHVLIKTFRPMRGNGANFCQEHCHLH